MLYDKDIREPLAFYLEEIYGKNRILEEPVSYTHLTLPTKRIV